MEHFAEKTPILCRQKLKHHLQTGPAGSAADVEELSVRPDGKSINISGVAAELLGH